MQKLYNVIAEMTADCCAVWVNACAAVMTESKKKNLGYLFRCGTNRVKIRSEENFFAWKNSANVGNVRRSVCTLGS